MEMLLLISCPTEQGKGGDYLEVGEQHVIASSEIS